MEADSRLFYATQLFSHQYDLKIIKAPHRLLGPDR